MQAIFHIDYRNRVCAGEGKVAAKQNNCKGKGRKKTKPRTERIVLTPKDACIHTYIHAKKNAFTFNS